MLLIASMSSLIGVGSGPSMLNSIAQAFSSPLLKTVMICCRNAWRWILSDFKERSVDHGYKSASIQCAGATSKARNMRAPSLRHWRQISLVVHEGILLARTRFQFHFDLIIATDIQGRRLRRWQLSRARAAAAAQRCRPKPCFRIKSSPPRDLSLLVAAHLLLNSAQSLASQAADPTASLSVANPQPHGAAIDAATHQAAMAKGRMAFVLIDGLGDVSIPELGNRTPLEAAHTPHLDAIAGGSRSFRFGAIPADLGVCLP